MSLEHHISLGLIDEGNPLDTSSSVNNLSSLVLGRVMDNIYSPDASIDMYALGIPMNTNQSFQFNDFETLQLSKEYKNPSLSENVTKTPLKSANPNKFYIQLESISDKSISELSFDESNPSIKPKKEMRASTIYTNLSSDTSNINTECISPKALEENKKDFNNDIHLSKNKLNSNRPIASIRNSTFALTNRIYCMKCNSETYTDVSFQMKDMNFWKSVGFFFTAIKCCGEPRALSRYQDIVHSCKKCGSVVARISTL